MLLSKVFLSFMVYYSFHRFLTYTFLLPHLALASDLGDTQVGTGYPKFFLLVLCLFRQMPS